MHLQIVTPMKTFITLQTYHWLESPLPANSWLSECPNLLQLSSLINDFFLFTIRNSKIPKGQKEIVANKMKRKTNIENTTLHWKLKLEYKRLFFEPCKRLELLLEVSLIKGFLHYVVERVPLKHFFEITLFHKYCIRGVCLHFVHSKNFWQETLSPKMNKHVAMNLCESGNWLLNYCYRKDGSQYKGGLASWENKRFECIMLSGSLYKCEI